MDNGRIYWRCSKRTWWRFKKEQAATEVAIEQLAGGGRIRKVVQHEDTIKRLKAEFANGVRSLDAFVNSLSHCVVLILVGNSLKKKLMIIMLIITF